MVPQSDDVLQRGAFGLRVSEPATTALALVAVNLRKSGSSSLPHEAGAVLLRRRD